jgi:flagellar hook-length control protein FliK
MDAAALLAVEQRASTRAAQRAQPGKDDGFADLVAREQKHEPATPPDERRQISSRDSEVPDEGTRQAGTAKTATTEAPAEILIALLAQAPTAPATTASTPLPSTPPGIGAATLPPTAAPIDLASVPPEAKAAPALVSQSPNVAAAAPNTQPQSQPNAPPPSAQPMPAQSLETSAASASPSAALTDQAAPDPALAPQQIAATTPTVAAQTAIALVDPRAGRAINSTAATASAKPRGEPAADALQTAKPDTAPARAAAGQQTANAVKPVATAADSSTQTANPAGASLTPGADSASALGTHTGAHSADTAGAGQTAAPPSLVKAHTVAQLTSQIMRKFEAGQTSFELRLDPVELGRVDIRLDVARDRRVHATISADSALTLSELSRAAKEIERALADAGLDVGEDGIQFNLNDPSGQSFAQRDDRNGRAGGEAAGRAGAFTDLSAQTPAAARPLALSRWAGERLDVWA